MKELHELNSVRAIDAFIHDHPLSFVYVSRQDCSVCHAVLPKLRSLLADYPQIRLGVVDAEVARDIASEFLIFSVPVLLLFVNGKELIREGRFVKFDSLRTQLDRIYEAYAI